MEFKELVPLAEQMTTGSIARPQLAETVPLGRAKMHVQQFRPKRFIKVEGADLADPAILEAYEKLGSVQKDDGLYIPDPDSYEALDEGEEVWNQITNSGRDFLHVQGYGTSGLGANGLNWIGLTNTAVTPAAGDTTLSGEIVANGLARAQGVVAHTGGTNTSTITFTFTCATAPQAAQAAALFTASSSGTMNHELTFTQRSLQIGDQLVVTYTITLG